MRPIEVHHRVEVFLRTGVVGETEMLTEISRTIVQIKKELEKIMPTLQERFDGLEAKADTTSTKLNEASTEILAELTALRAGGGLTPEQEASLTRIEAKAQGLVDTATALADTSPPIP